MKQDPCDILMIGELGLYPFDQGFKVHGSQMARALKQRGQNVRIATVEPIDTAAPKWLKEMCIAWPKARMADEARLIEGWQGSMQKLRHKLAGHQGINQSAFAGAMRLIDEHRPSVVVGLGQHSPMMLRSIQKIFPNVRTVWYAADELVFFQLSCLRRDPWRRWGRRLYDAAVYAALENAFARKLDGAIGVSPMDTKLLRWVAGPKQAVTIRNGVDLETFAPSEASQAMEQSAVFWGRMDFEPNVDAMRWFVREVWVQLRGACPGATLAIVGKNPLPQVRDLARYPGVTVTGAVDDIQAEAKKARVTILPMRCGGGIKNKLLEAAAMGLPIVASRRAVAGLDMGTTQRPVKICHSTDAWVETMKRLWQDASLRHDLGRKARAWVEREHNWRTAADRLIAFCGDALQDASKGKPPTTAAARRAA